MEIHPPIEKRTKEQLWEIIETREEWKDEVVKMAQEELIKRGISIINQETRRKNKFKYQERINSIKSRASYTTTEKILIVLFGPFLAALFHDIFFFQAGEGFKKKNRQGIFYLIFGIGLWFLIFYILNS